MRGRTPLATQSYWILLHPHPPCALDPNPADLSCLCSNDASGGALLATPQSTLQTLVGWGPQPQGEEGGKGIRPQPEQETSPRGRDQSQALQDPRKGLLSAPSHNGSSVPQSLFQNGREGRLQGLGLGTGLKQCRSGVTRPSPPFPDPRKIPCPEGADSPPHT